VSTDEGVALEIEDNGSGFDRSKASGLGHGLGNLRERADALGGVLSIGSGAGAGTLVRITIPN
jgi:signal transduction histidine kinase